MNQHPGIIGTKVGMTQLFEEDGTLVPCTVVQAGCVVIGKRTVDKDGYSALIVGLGEAKEKHASKAVVVALKKAGQTPKRVVRELRAPPEHVAQHEIGQQLKVEDIFEAGQRVDVQGTSKGRGFTGVVKKFNFRGASRTHGSHEWTRHAGSIGTTTTPGRVLPGRKMAGQHGNRTVSVLNVRVVRVVPEKQLILLEGGVPGPQSAVVRVRGAVKKRGGKPA